MQEKFIPELEESLNKNEFIEENNDSSEIINEFPGFVLQYEFKNNIYALAIKNQNLNYSDEILIAVGSLSLNRQNKISILREK